MLAAVPHLLLPLVHTPDTRHSIIAWFTCTLHGSMQSAHRSGVCVFKPHHSLLQLLSNRPFSAMKVAHRPGCSAGYSCMCMDWEWAPVTIAGSLLLKTRAHDLPLLHVCTAIAAFLLLHHWDIDASTWHAKGVPVSNTYLLLLCVSAGTAFVECVNSKWASFASMPEPTAVCTANGWIVENACKRGRQQKDDAGAYHVTEQVAAVPAAAAAACQLACDILLHMLLNIQQLSHSKHLHCPGTATSTN